MKLRTLKELDPSEGTVQLVDRGNSSGAEHLGNNDIILVPQPSHDPNDPLLWPQWKKMVVFINVLVFTFLGNANIGGLSPGLANIATEFGKDGAGVSGLLTWPILILGCSNFFWTPMAIWIGKRPVFVVASCILFATCVWAQGSKSFDSLLASVVIGSFASGSTEALGAAIVNDLFFLHERGAKMGIYLVFLSLGSSIGPLCGGFIIQNCGWVWFKRIMAIFTGVNFATVVLFAPETRFSRVLSIPTETDTSSTAIPDERPGEKVATDTAHEEECTASVVQPVPKRSYLQSLSLWSGTAQDGGILEIFIRPFALIVYPANFFAMISYAISLAWIVVVATNISFLLSAKPYSFSPSIIGLVNLPTMIGNLLGALATGWPSDKYAQWKSRRSDGVFQPEVRLLFNWLPGVFVPAGLLMYGYGAADQLPWIVIFIGAGCIAVGLTAVANVGMTYSVESYYPIAAESLLVINGFKNILAWAISYRGIQWIEDQGFKNAFGTMAGVTVAVLMFTVPLAFYGHRVRHYTSTNLRLICW
ncbi:hypothetical protein RBB50_011426 [Rhinocladiella similis]